MKKKIVFSSIGILLAAGCQSVRSSANFEEASCAPSASMGMMMDAEASAWAAKPADASERNFVSVPGRKMIFTASMTLEVPDVEEALRTVKQACEKVHGYVQSMDNNNIVLRIPVESADGLLQNCRSMGIVLDQSVVAQDVTDQTVEYQIRLENLTILRERLMRLAKTDSQKVTDLLEIERELSRVTGEIELYKGRLQLMENKISFVTLSLQFEQGKSEPNIRQSRFMIDWVSRLGTEIAVNPPEMNERDIGSLPYDVELPEHFAVLYAKGRWTTPAYAASGEGGIIKLSRFDNRKGANLHFWKTLIEKHFTEVSPLKGFKLQTLETSEGLPAIHVCGERRMGGKGETAGYMLWLTVYDDELYLYEYWAPLNVFEQQTEMVQKSFKTSNLSTWR